MVHGLQLEIEVDNVAQLETFWGRIPPQAHKAWGQRAQVQHSCHHANLVCGATAIWCLQKELLCCIMHEELLLS